VARIALQEEAHIGAIGKRGPRLGPLLAQLAL
jgi:hypothetical protein